MIFIILSFSVWLKCFVIKETVSNEYQLIFSLLAHSYRLIWHWLKGHNINRCCKGFKRKKKSVVISLSQIYIRSLHLKVKLFLASISHSFLFSHVWYYHSTTTSLSRKLVHFVNLLHSLWIGRVCCYLPSHHDLDKYDVHSLFWV